MASMGQAHTDSWRKAGIKAQNEANERKQKEAAQKASPVRRGRGLILPRKPEAAEKTPTSIDPALFDATIASLRANSQDSHRATVPQPTNANVVPDSDNTNTVANSSVAAPGTAQQAAPSTIVALSSTPNQAGNTATGPLPAPAVVAPSSANSVNDVDAVAAAAAANGTPRGVSCRLLAQAWKRNPTPRANYPASSLNREPTTHANPHGLSTAARPNPGHGFSDFPQDHEYWDYVQLAGKGSGNKHTPRETHWIHRLQKTESTRRTRGEERNAKKAKKAAARSSAPAGPVQQPAAVQQPLPDLVADGIWSPLPPAPSPTFAAGISVQADQPRDLASLPAAQANFQAAHGAPLVFGQNGPAPAQVNAAPIQQWVGNAGNAVHDPYMHYYPQDPILYNMMGQEPMLPAAASQQTPMPLMAANRSNWPTDPVFDYNAMNDNQGQTAGGVFGMRPEMGDALLPAMEHEEQQGMEGLVPMGEERSGAWSVRGVDGMAAPTFAGHELGFVEQLNWEDISDAQYQ